MVKAILILFGISALGTVVLVAFLYLLSLVFDGCEEKAKYDPINYLEFDPKPLFVTREEWHRRKYGDESEL